MSATPMTNPEQPGDALAGKLKRTELQRSASSIPGREIVQVPAEIPCGSESSWHIPAHRSELSLRRSSPAKAQQSLVRCSERRQALS